MKTLISICDWFVDNKLSIPNTYTYTKSIVFRTNKKLNGLRELDVKRDRYTD